MSSTDADTPDEKSAGEWMQIAKRAQDLVGKVDLGRVVDHNDPEVRKLKKVVEALDELNDGKLVGEIEGVDVEEPQDEAPPVIDERAARIARVLADLEAAGYAGRIGRVFLDSAGDMRPREIVAHSEGLPQYDMVVAPEYSPAPGAHAIFISDKGVFAAHVPDPVNEHRWRILRSRPFEDEPDLIATVSNFIVRSD
ncbi:MAG: hypothetical protein NXH85_07565 [Pseudomonadaceae bacterium]|nr:hypothetical protein [Pseudomonadaceae bacterium]